MGKKSNGDFNGSTGQRITALRKEKGMSQDELALILNIERTKLSKIECGKRSLTIEELNILSEFFDVSVNYLLCKTDSRKSNSDYIKESLSIEEIRLSLTKELIENLANNIKNNYLNNLNPSQQKLIATRVYNILTSK